MLKEFDEKDLLDDTFIEILREHVKLLTPFKYSTLELEKENSTVSNTICEVVALSCHLKEWLNTPSYNATKKAAELMNKKIGKVLSHYLQYGIVIASVILDKSLSDWKNIITDPAHQDLGLTYIKVELQKLNTVTNQTIHKENDVSKQSDNMKTSLGKSFKIVKSTERDEKDELEIYFESKMKDPDQHMTSWWNEKIQRDSMPNLSLIALKIFIIPGSSSDSERTWSMLGRIWTPSRNRLEPEIVSNLGFLKSNNDKW